jgi:CheY-like chemotaxis protein
MKILIADDDSFLRKFYALVLGREGYTVCVAQDGGEALECAREFRPDVILLDILMPIKDGFDVLRDLKGDQDLRDIPTAMLTNLSQASDREKSRTLGAVRYFVKAEVKVTEFIESVASLTKKKKTKKKKRKGKK